MSQDQPIKQINNLRILSLDGGGIRGIALARILQEIETHFNKPVSELFDLIVGTSTGGLLSMMLTIPNKYGEVMRAKDAKDLYCNQAQVIFTPSVKHEITRLGSKYVQKGLENVILQIWGAEPTLKDAKTHVGVTCTDEIHSSSILLNSFRAKKHPGDYRHNAMLVNIAKATCAAPTYFPHVIIAEHAVEVDPEDNPCEESVMWFEMDKPKYRRKDIMFEDGGTSNNNPAALGLKLIKHVLKHHNVTAKNIQVISIGTGSCSGWEEDPEDNEKFWKNVGSGIFGVVERTLIHDPFRVAIKAYEVHKKLLQKYKDKDQEENYIRVQFKINKHQANVMDDCSQKNISSLICSAENYLYENLETKAYSEHFKRVLNMIAMYNKTEGALDFKDPVQVIKRAPSFQEKEGSVHSIGTLSFEAIDEQDLDMTSYDNLEYVKEKPKGYFSSETIVNAATYFVPMAVGAFFGLKK